MGAVSDRLGRRPLLISFTALMLVSAYPMQSWLAAAPWFERLLIVELSLSFTYGSYNGAMVVALTEVIPVRLRTPPRVSYSGFTPD
jgi:MFS transporter, MHS family, citrate/tricarballylate:H+ symporter